MKKLIILLSLIFAGQVQAKHCTIKGKITNMFQYTDGMIFINVDNSGDCACPHKNRMAFHKRDDEKFYMSAALTALTAGKTVTMVGEDGNGTCPVHSNSAKIISFNINAN